MATTASLQLLKGAQKKVEAGVAEVKQAKKSPKKATLPVEAAEPAAVTAEPAVVEPVEVEIADMTASQLDALVKDNELSVPATWAKMKLSDKKAWLEKTYGEEAEETVAEAQPEPPFDADAPASVPAVVEPKAAKGKGKKPGKAVAAKALSGDVLGPDPIADLVNEIENLGERDALDLAITITDQTEFGYFKLGGVLSVIKKNAWYKANFNSFREYVEQVHGLKYRTADYYVDIYDHMADNGVPWVKVKDVGWTKLKEIAGIITPDNVDQWVAAAATMTTYNLNKAVEAFKKGGTTKQVTTTSYDVKVLTFKVHADQKDNIEAALEKAMAAGGTDVRTVALEYVCLEYVGGKAKIDLVKLLTNAGIDKALAAFDKAFPDANLSYTPPGAEAGGEDSEAA